MDPVSTSPTKHLGTGVVTFTPRGEAALDNLAAALANRCDGSPASITDVLKQILDADIERLAEAVSEAADSSNDAATLRPRRPQPKLTVAPRLQPRTVGR